MKKKPRGLKAIQKLYLNPKEPGSFSGLSGFTKNQNKTKAVAIKALKKVPAYYLYKETKASKYRPVVVHFPLYQITFDLLDLSKYSKFNEGNKFVLIVVDCFTRKFYAVALKNKKAETVIDGFKKIFASLPKLPK